MSDSRGGGRAGSDGKENRQRRQRSESVCPTVWQITSNSRCIACGQLGDTCDCRTTRMDPALKRQKLDNFLLNTPHVRCKQIRVLNEVVREESKQRLRLLKRWEHADRLIARIVSTQRRLDLLEHEETAEREGIVATERRECADALTLANRHIVLRAIARHEREERLSLCLYAQREAQQVMIWHTFVFQLLGLQNREAAFRDAHINDEAAAVAALRGLGVKLLNVIDKNENERRGVCEEYWEKREQIVLQWQREVETLQGFMINDRERAEWIGQERFQIFELCVRQKTELASQEVETRTILYATATNEFHLVLEKIRCCEEESAVMSQEESAERLIIIQNVDFTLNELVLKFKYEAEEIRSLTELKYQQSEAELQLAIHHLRTIAEEEETAIAALMAQERREKDQRYQWMLEKERERNEFAHFTLRQIQRLYDEAEVAHHTLKSAMQEDEIGVAAWIQQKARKLRELAEAGVSQKGKIRMEEHEERFALVSYKAEHEDAVRRWLDQKESVRQCTITEEVSSRVHVLDMEHTAREEIVWHFECGLEMCHSVHQGRVEAQIKFQQKALAALGEVVQQEVKAMILIRDAAQNDMEHALQEEKHRLLIEFLNTEIEYRSCMLQQEVRCRENISTQMQLEKTFFTKEAQEILNTRLCEIITAEESQRHVLLHLVDESVERVWFLGRRSFEDAERRESERTREELRQREIALLEDARLYWDGEMLVFNPADTPEQDDTCTDSSAIDESWKLRRRYVLTELGLEETDGNELTSSSVDFLAKVVKLITEKKSLIMAELHQTEKDAEEAERKMEKQRLLLSNAKERCDTLKQRLKRNAVEHERRVAMYREARQKDELQLERERGRLQAKMEALRQMQENVSSMRDAIHNQYQSR